MATALPDIEFHYETIAQVVQGLPDIPLSRIRLQPTPGTATEEDIFLARRESGKLCEIFDGVLVEKPMGTWESIIVVHIIIALGEFINNHSIEACLSGEATMVRLIETQIRLPDVAVILRSQFPSGQYPTDNVWAASPDLAVEVLSDSNTRAEMARKIDEYFTAGSRLVWLVDRRTTSVTVYTSPSDLHVVDIEGTLDGGDVLPGLKLPVRRIFSAP